MIKLIKFQHFKIILINYYRKRLMQLMINKLSNIQLINQMSYMILFGQIFKVRKIKPQIKEKIYCLIIGLIHKFKKLYKLERKYYNLNLTIQLIFYPLQFLLKLKFKEKMQSQLLITYVQVFQNKINQFKVFQYLLLTKRYAQDLNIISIKYKNAYLQQTNGSQKKQLQSKIKLSDQLNNLTDTFIKKQRSKINGIVRYLKQQLFSYIQQQVCYYKALINKMDDWIIFGIKQQNDFTYKIYKQLKTSIQKISKSQLKDLFPSPITNYVKPIERIGKYHQPIPYINNQTNIFDYCSFKIFLQQIKCFGFTSNSKSGNSQGIKINFLRFKDYFNKRIKSKLLSDIYLKLDFDTMQQYLVLQNEANLKQVALGMLFWNFTVLDEESLNNYSNKLSNNRQNEYISQPQQLSLSQFFMQANNLSEKQRICIEYFIFDIMKSEYTYQFSIREFIDILKMFNSLQLFKYGDSLMMLNQQKQK